MQKNPTKIFSIEPNDENESAEIAAITKGGQMMWETVITQGIHPSLLILFVGLLLAVIVVAWRYRLLLVLKWWQESGASPDELARVIEAHEGTTQQRGIEMSGMHSDLRYPVVASSSAIRRPTVRMSLIVEVILLLALGVVGSIIAGSLLGAHEAMLDEALSGKRISDDSTSGDPTRSFTTFNNLRRSIWNNDIQGQRELLRRMHDGTVSWTAYVDHVGLDNSGLIDSIYITDSAPSSCEDPLECTVPVYRFTTPKDVVAIFDFVHKGDKLQIDGTLDEPISPMTNLIPIRIARLK